MAYYTTVRRRKRRIINIKIPWKIIVILCITITGIVWWYCGRVRPILIDTAEANIDSVTTMAINTAVLEVVSANTSYSELVSIDKNDNNDIVLVSANTAYINALALDTATTVQSQLTQLINVGVSIPIGTLSGIPFLTGVGPDISIAVTPISSVSCSFVSSFTSAGINQTMHQIYLQVYCDIDIVIPTLTRTITSTTDVLVCETIIVGDIPDTYLEASILGSS